MKKRIMGENKKLFLIVIGIALLLVALILFGKYLAFAVSSGKSSVNSIKNPIEGLSQEQAIAKFDESFVSYLLSLIGAGRLRNIPFTSNNPKIEVKVSGTIYSAEIKKGEIVVSKGPIANPDLRIYTSKEEGIKMMKDKGAIKNSFQSGASGLEVVAGKPTLLMKGYWSIYGELS